MKPKKPHRKKPKRIGRGHGSGHGKTSSRGHKGQGSRSGFSMHPGFEGGQTPLYLKLGKRGFINPNKKHFTIMNLEDLNQFEVEEISPDWLLERGAIKRLRDGLKILGGGKLKKKVNVRAHRFSAHAKEAIEKAGGKAVVITEQ
jgi:large subunit ribosomal protein L15